MSRFTVHSSHAHLAISPPGRAVAAIILADQEGMIPTDA
jgi:hypothetical protein